MKEYLIKLFNCPEAKNLPSWASWGINNEADILALPDTDDDLWGLAGNLCIDVHDDMVRGYNWYMEHIDHIQKAVDEHYKPKL
jgi:hypothetical protein